MPISSKVSSNQFRKNAHSACWVQWVQPLGTFIPVQYNRKRPVLPPKNSRHRNKWQILCPSYTSMFSFNLIHTLPSLRARATTQNWPQPCSLNERMKLVSLFEATLKRTAASSGGSAPFALLCLWDRNDIVPLLRAVPSARMAASHSASLTITPSNNEKNL
jgi:hypothetical protein